MSTVTQIEVPTVRARSVHLVHQKLTAEEPTLPDINTIRKAIPPHCFKPSTWRSLSYVVRDLLMAGALTYAAITFIPSVSSPAYRTLLWVGYGFLQGLVGVGIWILAHECGHGAFSLHRRLNDFVGWVLHSALLVPFFSWKFSHARHHRFTGHMQKDMAFVPKTSPSYFVRSLGGALASFIDLEMLEDAPLVNLIRLLGQQLGGWQVYMLLNATAGDDSLQNKDAKWWRLSHFDPFSGVFRPQEALYVLISDLGLALVAAGLYFASQALDWQTVFLLYGVPYFWVNHSTTPTKIFRTMMVQNGASSPELSQPSIVISASSAVTSFTVLSTLMSFITYFRVYLSTMQRKPQRRSSLSSEISITATSVRSWVSYGRRPTHASMWRVTRAILVL